MLHTILGAGGSIGNALAHRLIESRAETRLVSRRGVEMQGAQSVRADLNDAAQTAESVQGSDVVYLVAGLPYDGKVWKASWPRIMRNTIEACKKARARLIFFDNVYMYGLVEGTMTEMTPYRPCSRKGEVRAEIASMLEGEIKKGVITALIARAADLYGPFAEASSLPYIMVFSRMLKGRPAQWVVNARLPHTYAYTLDCAEALVLLATDDGAWNQVWHLPCASPGISGESFIKIAARELNMPEKYSVLGKWMIGFAGLFNKQVAETYEMLYQNENPYDFSSLKFQTHFHYAPKSYEEGIRETLWFLKGNPATPSRA